MARYSFYMNCAFFGHDPVWRVCAVSETKSAPAGSISSARSRHSSTGSWRDHDDIWKLALLDDPRQHQLQEHFVPAGASASPSTGYACSRASSGQPIRKDVIGSGPPQDSREGSTSCGRSACQRTAGPVPFYCAFRFSPRRVRIPLPPIDRQRVRRGRPPTLGVRPDAPGRA